MKPSSYWLLALGSLAALLLVFLSFGGGAGSSSGFGPGQALASTEQSSRGELPGVRLSSETSTGALDTYAPGSPATQLAVPASVPSPKTARKTAERPATLLVVSSLNPGTPDQQRLANIAFELRRPGAPLSAPPLFAGSTAANGECLVQLDWEGFRLPPTLDRPHFMGRVLQDGYQRHRVRPEVRDEGSRELRMDLLMIPGATFHGRVSDPAGRGVEANVCLFAAPSSLDVAPSSRPPTEATKVPTTASQLGGGRFELHLERGTVGDLVARCEGVGTASLRDLQLDVSHPREDLHLVLSGNGMIRGRLLDTGGAPIPGHIVQVRLAKLESASSKSSERLLLEQQLMTQGSGFISSRTPTNEEGWFLIQGLRKELYVVRTSQKAVDYRYALLLTEEPVLADGRVLSLTLPASAPEVAATVPRDKSNNKQVLVTLRFLGEVLEEDLKAVERMNLRIRTSRGTRRMKFPTDMVHLALRDDQGRSQRLVPAPGSLQAGGDQWTILLGETHMFQITGTGKHELIGRMPGGRKLVVPVDLDGPSSISIDMQF